MLKMHAVVQKQLAACTCSIPPPSYLKQRKLTLGFSFQRYIALKRIKVGCTCVHMGDLYIEIGDLYSAELIQLL